MMFDGVTVDPVKNKKCGHIYEKSTIYAMIDLARYYYRESKIPSYFSNSVRQDHIVVLYAYFANSTYLHNFDSKFVGQALANNIANLGL